MAILIYDIECLETGTGNCKCDLVALYGIGRDFYKSRRQAKKQGIWIRGFIDGCPKSIMDFGSGPKPKIITHEGYPGKYEKIEPYKMSEEQIVSKIDGKPGIIISGRRASYNIVTKHKRDATGYMKCRAFYIPNEEWAHFSDDPDADWRDFVSTRLRLATPEED